MEPARSSRKRAFLPTEDSHTHGLPAWDVMHTRICTPESLGMDHMSRKRKRPSSPDPSSGFSAETSRSSIGEIGTPPTSALESAPTMRLSLSIPQPELSRAEQNVLERRRAAANRWKPKLQRAPPKTKEVSDAYPLKLMRHYPAPSVFREPDFIKPRIHRSNRVDRLIQRFPLSTASNVGSTATSQGPIMVVPKTLQLQANIQVTKSEQAQRLAWSCFSATEEDRIDRGREAMIVSGLDWDELLKEHNGRPNQLPEWRKGTTGRFAKSQGH